MTPHPQHEAILRECMTSDDPAGALRSSAAAGCQDCVEEVEELLGVQEQLGALGHDLRAVLANPSAAAGEHLPARTLGPPLALRGRSRRLARAAAWTAAAALLLIAIVLWRRDRREEAGPMLGPIGLELVSPRARVPDYGTFVWRARLPPDGWYEIRVLAPDGRELARETIEEPRWTSESTTDWPDEIRWQVRAFDASGALLGVLEAAASRSSR